MGWKKFIMGEKMPDKCDPKYAERYEKEVKDMLKLADEKFENPALLLECFGSRAGKLLTNISWSIASRI